MVKECVEGNVTDTIPASYLQTHNNAHIAIDLSAAARPTGDGVLQIVENLDVYIIGRTVEGKQLTQTVFVIIFVSQFKNRLSGQLAQPDDGAAVL